MNEQAWQLSAYEATAYSEAVANFLRWHMPAFNANGKRGSEIALFGVMAMIYLPKAVYVFQKRRGMIAPGAPVPQAAPIVATPGAQAGNGVAHDAPDGPGAPDMTLQ